MVSGGERLEIAFFDVETTVPTRPGQGFAILEFGAILVCPRKLVELQSYSTLVRPADLSLISTLSVRCNGITRDAVVSAPTFADIADRVFDILHERIWAGHNILKFDCARVREAFAEINRPAPVPKGTIDSLALLTQRFGRRAGDMKMASLATYFGLGRQTHRSLDDVRMNLEVLKYCATVLFLESSLPEIFTTNSWVSPNATTRSRSNGKASPEGMSLNASTPSSSVRIENHQISSPTDQTMVENHPILSLMTPNTVEELPEELESTTARADPFDMGGLSDEIDRESRKAGDPTNIANSLLMMEEKSGSESAESSTAADPKGSVSCNEFVEPDKVSLPSICVSRARNYYGAEKIQILWKGAILQLFCPGLKVRFGTNSKYIDYAGRPRLSLVVSASRSLCQVLDACDNLAQKFPVDSDRISEWKPVVTRKSGYLNSPTVRLHLPTVMDGNVVRWMTAIHQKESSTSTQKLVFSRFDIAELGALFAPGTFVDAYFSVDTYDYQQKAGIRLVAKKLVVHTS